MDKLIHKDLKIIHKHNKPYGIRDENGFLFFFTKISKYGDQEERYKQEVFEQYELAEFMVNSLEARRYNKWIS